jgi:hypothetical protein
MIGVRKWAIPTALTGAALVAVASLGFRPLAATEQARPASRQSSPARTGHYRTELPAATKCPPEELSCGLQKPVLSDGVRRFENENYGLRMTFPRGSAVCMTRSGNAPHGFFAAYGSEPSCAERPERRPRFISVYAEFNALFYTSIAEALPDGCGPLSDAVRRQLESRELAFPGHRSATCQTPSGGGNVEISVYTLAGPWDESGPPPAVRSRSIVFSATLGTTPARLGADVARFREVLRSIQIRSTR